MVDSAAQLPSAGVAAAVPDTEGGVVVLGPTDEVAAG
jgi:hypothetical protein